MNSYLKKIAPYALPYKKYAILNIISNIFYALFATISMLSLMPMLEVMFQNGEQIRTIPAYQGIGKLVDYFKEYANYFITLKTDEDGVLSALTIVVIVIIVTFLLKNIFGYLAVYFITFMRNGVLKDLRNDVYKKTIDLPVSYFSEKKKGDVMARILGDVGEIQTSFLSVLEMIVREPLTIIFALYTMYSLSAKLTLFVFVFIPIAGFVISLIGKTLNKHSTKVQKEQGNFLSILEETLGGLKIIKGFNAERKFSENFNNSTSRFFKFSNALAHRQNLASPVSEVLGISVIAVLLWVGGRMVLVENELSAADFIVYLTLAYNILDPAKKMSRASYSIKKGNAAAERVMDILETKSPLEDIENPIVKNSFDSDIKFDNISFKYEDHFVLKNFSLTIPKGKTIALVGQSGSGKSTIANLVTRFYDINKGSITMDGINIKEISKQSLREQMGLVTQDAILFHDTIANNIAFGKKLSENDVIEAAKIANAHDFIMEQPNGYQTNIGDGGNKLSGGQKQRISIARAILKNPPIMILDEATSALDTESEKSVQIALEKLMENRTSIVIAHRLSTIQNADLIVVLHQGEIVEKGTHNELIKAKGTYHKLVSMQSLEYR
ncbi:MAG: ABC transporter ATP-binding protein [Flavobacteriaceae bacterium]